MTRMTKIITKAQVIKALKTEPLKQGSWFRYIDDGFIPEDCTVCAVGAVLRHVSFVKWANRHEISGLELGRRAVKEVESRNIILTSYEEAIKYHLKKKNWLAALSSYFEQGYTKTKCIAWVKRNFPKSFKLTIKA